MVRLLSKNKHFIKKKSKKIQKGALSDRECTKQDYYINRNEPDKERDCYDRYIKDAKEECLNPDYVAKEDDIFPCNTIKESRDITNCINNGNSDPKCSNLNIKKELEDINSMNDEEKKLYKIICNSNNNFIGNDYENFCKKINEPPVSREECIKDDFGMNSYAPRLIEGCKKFWPEKKECQENSYYQNENFLKYHCDQFKPLTKEACVIDRYFLNTNEEDRKEECRKFYPPNQEECYSQNYYNDSENLDLINHCNQFKQNVELINSRNEQQASIPQVQNVEQASIPQVQNVEHASIPPVQNVEQVFIPQVQNVEQVFIPQVQNGEQASIAQVQNGEQVFIPQVQNGQQVEALQNLPKWLLDPLNNTRIMLNPVLYLKNFQIYDRDNLPEKIVTALNNEGESIDLNLLIPQERLKSAIDEYIKRFQGGKKIVKSRKNKNKRFLHSKIHKNKRAVY
jgi:DNA-directed RNA polymerase subunit N (RpoN/RPB10)